MVLGLLVAGCILEVPRGPDLGACAQTPQGVYRYGEAGIGTCIAGPADLQFFGQDGGTFLGVVNADPFHEYRGGSLLVIDWDALGERLVDAPPDRIPMDEVAATAFTWLDDDDGDGIGNNPFFGGFGYVPGSQAGILTTRLSENGILRAGRDEALVLDFSRMELGAGEIRLAGKLELEDDPQPVVVDAERSRAWVGNLTDHSISVLTASPGLDAALPFAEVDVATDAGTSEGVFADVDGSGSFAELSRSAVVVPEDLVDDAFTFTWVDASIRLYVPSPLSDDDEPDVGVVRWFSAGDTRYRESAFGPERGTTGDLEARDPFLELTDEGVPTVWYSAPDGTIQRAIGTTAAGEWVEEGSVLSGGRHTAPSAAPLADGVGLYTGFTQADGDRSVIRLAVSGDRVTFEDAGTVLEPADGESYDHPFAVLDSGVGEYRMWFTLTDADGDHVAYSHSDDGRVWTAPERVLDGAAAPTVAVLDGRYAMWTAVSDGARWSHAVSTSFDGHSWTEPVVVAPSELPFDPAEPPRAGVLSQRTGAWRFTSETGGDLEALLPSGTPSPIPLLGLELALASGHEVSNHVVGDGVVRSMVPGSAVPLRSGGHRVFVTVAGAGGRERIAVLDRLPASFVGGPATWSLVTGPDAIDADLDLRPAERISSPVASCDDAGDCTVFASLADNAGSHVVRLHATATGDGLAFDPVDRARVVGRGDFDTAFQTPGSLQADEGRIRLWYAGSDGSRQTIGSAVADDVDGEFTREEGRGTDFRMGTGLPGSFDDTEVADPLVIEIAGVTHLYYSGFDGTSWHLGHATLDRGTFVRRTSPTSDLGLASMNGLDRSFSSLGVRRPVLLGIRGGDGAGVDLLYAGVDGLGTRIGAAHAPLGELDLVFPTPRYPTAGDTIGFSSTRGLPGAEVIELGRVTQWYAVESSGLPLGSGMSGLVHDPDRGFLYVTSKTDANLYVVDVRDDSDGAFRDDPDSLETYVRVEPGSIGGFRGGVVRRSRDLLYLTQKTPDALVVLDLGRIADDASLLPTDRAVVAVLPFPDAAEDLGATTLAGFGGGQPALTDDERYLLVPHFRQNALSVWDLDRGPYGEEIAWIPWVGENPHEVVISPDGRWAVVANYVGEVIEGTALSNLAVVDLDPGSETYLEVVTWLVNR